MVAPLGQGRRSRWGNVLLGDFYFNGEDGPPERSIAEEWYARAAKQGDAHAQDMLSWLLTDGDHRQPDFGQASDWALKAASKALPLHDALGLLYHNALGVERDAPSRREWWRKAARLGDGDGQAMLRRRASFGSRGRAQPRYGARLADKSAHAAQQICRPVL